MTIDAVKMHKKEQFINCWWKCKLVQQPLMVMWSFLRKLRIDLHKDLNILHLGIHPKDSIFCYKDTYLVIYFIVSLFTIARTWKCPRSLLTVEWIMMMWCIYTVEYH